MYFLVSWVTHLPQRQQTSGELLIGRVGSLIYCSNELHPPL